MKKICYLLSMLCTLCVMSACSDDDDNFDVSVPVTEIVVPAVVQAGGELIIAGNGFSKDCKIILRDDAQSQEITVAERLSASIGCSVPKTLTPGEYTVILVQGGEWPLRKITVLEEGAVNPSIPVSALMLPKGPVTAGEEVTIQGLGFAKNCEILLKVGEEWQKMEITASNTGVKFTLPATFTAGVYPVMLKQDGGEWTIGEITVEAKAVEVRNQIDKITHKEDGDEEVSNFTYDEQGRINLIEVLRNGEKYKKVLFIWADDKLTVQYFTVDRSSGEYYDDPDYVGDYTLGADRKTVQSIESGWFGDNETYACTYFPDGYLNMIGEDCKYTMEGNNIQAYTKGSDNYILSYEGGQANKCVIDLMGEILYYWYIETEDQYYARIAGIAGSIPEQLPSSATYLGETEEENFPVGDVEYETYGDGYISKIIFDDGHVIEVTYK